MVHPQKRISVKKALEGTMGRLLSIKAWLVTNTGEQYVNLDDILVDLKLTPDVLELPVPKYFVEEGKADRELRDDYIGQVYDQNNLTRPYEDEEDDAQDEEDEEMDMDEDDLDSELYLSLALFFHRIICYSCRDYIT